MSVPQGMEQYHHLLEEEVRDIAWETGAVKREGKLDAATLVQTFIFGYWQNPDMQLSGLKQVAARRDVEVTGSAISQRLTPETAEMLHIVLQRLVAIRWKEEKVDIPFLKRFSAVIVEDSTVVTLPTELAEQWKGCGGAENASMAAVKAFTQWNVLTGALTGPELTDGRVNDHKSPFPIEDVAAGSLYLADLGFFAIQRLCAIAREKRNTEGKKQKRYFVSRLQAGTNLYYRDGRKVKFEGILPQQIDQVKEFGAVLGQRNGMAVRALMVKVPDEVAKDRKERMMRNAQKHGNVVSEESLKMAHWTILITNVPMKRANYQEIFILLRLRWQIERLFRLWKENGKIDEWRTKKTYGVLCEFYAKLCAMVFQHHFIQEGGWSDPERSIVKMAACLSRECNRIMVAFYEGNLEKTVQSILRLIGMNNRIDRRVAKPSTAQLLLNGLDWQLELLC
jgi:Transposase DDE domain